MPSFRTIYIAIMVVAGIALALASFKWPIINDGPIPPFMSLLGVSLVMDLVIINRAMAGKANPLTMETRFIGFFASAGLYFVLRLVLAG